MTDNPSLRKWRVRFAWVPRDLWIGLFIGKPRTEEGLSARTFYVCLLPTLVVEITRFSPPPPHHWWMGV